MTQSRRVDSIWDPACKERHQPCPAHRPDAGCVGLAVHLRSLLEYSRRMSISTPSLVLPPSPFSSSPFSFTLSLAQAPFPSSSSSSCSSGPLFYPCVCFILFTAKNGMAEPRPPHAAVCSFLATDIRSHSGPAAALMEASNSREIWMAPGLSVICPSVQAHELFRSLSSGIPVALPFCVLLLRVELVMPPADTPLPLFPHCFLSLSSV